MNGVFKEQPGYKGRIIIGRVLLGTRHEAYLVGYRRFSPGNGCVELRKAIPSLNRNYLGREGS